jgi:hypothetical protein
MSCGVVLDVTLGAAASAVLRLPLHAQDSMLQCS